MHLNVRKGIVVSDVFSLKCFNYFGPSLWVERDNVELIFLMSKEAPPGVSGNKKTCS